MALLCCGAAFSFLLGVYGSMAGVTKGVILEENLLEAADDLRLGQWFNI